MAKLIYIVWIIEVRLTWTPCPPWTVDGIQWSVRVWQVLLYFQWRTNKLTWTIKLPRPDHVSYSSNSKLDYEESNLSSQDKGTYFLWFGIVCDLDNRITLRGHQIRSWNWIGLSVKSFRNVVSSSLSDRVLDKEVNDLATGPSPFNDIMIMICRKIRCDNSRIDESLHFFDLIPFDRQQFNSGK